MTRNHTRLSSVKEALEDIGNAGEAARLQLHLLSLQARQRTSGLEASIDTLEQKLDRGIEQAMQTASLKTKQLTETLQEFLGRSVGQTADGAVLVRAVMSDGMRCCRPEDSLTHAAQIMWDTDCGAVGVNDAAGRLCGIVTDRDMCMAAFLRGQALENIRVQDVMTREVHTCSVDDTLEHAASAMGNAEVRRLPVIDSEGRAVGMLSLADVARNAGILGTRNAEHLTHQLLRAVSKRRVAAPQSADEAAE
jgi:CBS-domain-containing membrane protein